jgi:hypothetical protein
MSDKELLKTTKEAEKEEEERKRRVAEKQKLVIIFNFDSKVALRESKSCLICIHLTIYFSSTGF